MSAWRLPRPSSSRVSSASRPLLTCRGTAVPRASTLSPTFGSSSPGATIASSRHWWPGATTSSCTCGGYRTCGGSSPPRCPAGCPSSPASTAPASSTASWSTHRSSTSAGRASRQSRQRSAHAPAVRGDAHRRQGVDQSLRLRARLPTRSTWTADLRDGRCGHRRPWRGARAPGPTGAGQGGARWSWSRSRPRSAAP